MSQNGLLGKSNKYRSPNSTIVGGPGMMYNEATRVQTPSIYNKSAQYQNNNTYMVTVARHNVKSRK